VTPDHVLVLKNARAVATGMPEMGHAAHFRFA
jgi:hypothetical protein